MVLSIEDEQSHACAETGTECNDEDYADERA